MAILTFGGIVSTQAVGPASCSQRRTYLSATENKGKCVSQQEKKKKKKKKIPNIQTSNPFGGTSFLKAKQHCTFWYPNPKFAPSYIPSSQNPWLSR
jgi:hypothetical protein